MDTPTLLSVPHSRHAVRPRTRGRGSQGRVKAQVIELFCRPAQYTPLRGWGPLGTNTTRAIFPKLVSLHTGPASGEWVAAATIFPTPSGSWPPWGGYESLNVAGLSDRSDSISGVTSFRKICPARSRPQRLRSGSLAAAGGGGAAAGGGGGGDGCAICRAVDRVLAEGTDRSE
jgi:hypothetical protein